MENILWGICSGILLAAGVVLFFNALSYSANKLNPPKPSPMEVFLKMKIQEVETLKQERNKLDQEKFALEDTLRLASRLTLSGFVPDSPSATWQPLITAISNLQKDSEELTRRRPRLTTGCPASCTRHPHS